MGKLSGFLRSSGVGMSDYLHLHAPAADWLLGIVGPTAPRVSDGAGGGGGSGGLGFCGVDLFCSSRGGVYSYS